ncbi:hypothetical protein Gpo141_00004661 [Globisporangium polare]
MAMLIPDSDGGKHPPTIIYKSVPSQIPAITEENRVQLNGFDVRLWKRMQKIQERVRPSPAGQLQWTLDAAGTPLCGSVIMMKVPPGYTSISQPADVCWMKPFKDQLRAQWSAFLREQIESGATHRDFTGQQDHSLN